MASTHIRTCPLCEATCGLELTISEGSITRIRGDRDDVFSKGFICPKGSMLGALDSDPDRLRAPMIRENGALRPATWDEAWARVEEGLNAVVSAHGRQAVALYAGNPSAHGHEGPILISTMIKSFFTTNIFTASTVDQMPKHVSCGLMFGNPLFMPVPDVDRTDYLLMLGANPWVSNGSLATAPDWPGRLKAISARGGKVVVVDPKRTKTAKEADEHIAIRPGTDVWFLLGIVNVLFAQDRVRLAHLEQHVTGVDDVRALVEPYTPASVADVTGVPAETIERIARELSDAPSASVYDRIGAHTVEFGTLTSWAADVINVLTGNLDREGGKMFPLPAHGRSEASGKGRGFSIGRWRSRVHGLPEVRSELPVVTLPDEIETPGEGQIRALICVAGNPAVSNPNAARLERALASLEFMVSVDVYVNETSRHADVILPPPAPLERSHYDWGFYGLSVRNVVNYSPALREAQGPAEWEILARLTHIGRAVGTGEAAGTDPREIAEGVLDEMIDREVRSAGSPLHGRDAGEIRAALEDRDGVERILDFRLRSGPYGDGFGANPEGLTLAKLEANPHGIDLGPLTRAIPDRLRTPSGTIELAAAPIVEDFERLARGFADRRARGDALVLIGRRHLRSNNSWMHNVAPLVGGTNRCTLEINPTDAERLGLADGETAVVRSGAGEVTATVEVTDAMMPGVVSLPHGWGHGTEGSRLRVADANAGVNSNVLTEAHVFDVLSGNAVLNAIPVEVAAVRAEALAAN